MSDGAAEMEIKSWKEDRWLLKYRGRAISSLIQLTELIKLSVRGGTFVGGKTEQPGEVMHLRT